MERHGSRRKAQGVTLRHALGAGAAAGEEGTQGRQESPANPSELLVLFEVEDPLLAEVSAQHVAKWRASFELDDDNDFGFFFTSWGEAKQAGLAVAQAWR